MVIRTDTEYFFHKKQFCFPDIFNVENVWDMLSKKNDVITRLNDELDFKSDLNLPGVYTKGPVFIDRDTVVHPFTILEAKETQPIYIGKECELGPFLHVREGVMVGDNVKLGAHGQIKNSIVMNNTRIPHDFYLADSIVGSDVNIGLDFKHANLRHDGKNVRRSGYETSLRKFGCVIGDESKIGIRTTVYEGTLISPGFYGTPGEVLKGFIEQKR